MKCTCLIIVIVAISMFCLSPITSAKENTDTFHVGYFIVKPHAMPDKNSKAEGAAVEYFKRIAEKMGLPMVRFSLFPINRLLMVLEQNRIDMALLFAKDPGRSERFEYPAQPFCNTRSCVAVRISNPLKTIQKVDDLLPFTIQVSASAHRSSFILDPRLKIEPLYGDDFATRCIKKLRYGRVDACYQPDNFPIQFEAGKAQNASLVRVLLLPEDPIGLFSVFSKQSAKSYLKKYEAALDQVKKEISYQEVFTNLINMNIQQKSSAQDN